jgi:phosphoribosylamine--glycine ligase
VLGNPYVIEYNVRMGDPEAEVVLPRVKTDLLDLFIAVAGDKLNEKTIQIDPQTVCTIMMVSGGYPGKYEKGKEITGLEKENKSVIFHAGTRHEEGKILTNGGRVLSITSYGEDMSQALARSYNTADQIKFEGKFYRKDIGFDLQSV